MWSVQLAKIKDEINQYSNISSGDYHLYTNNGYKFEYFELEVIKENIYTGKKRVLLPFRISKRIVRITSVI